MGRRLYQYLQTEPTYNRFVLEFIVPSTYIFIIDLEKFDPAGTGFHFVWMARNVTSANSDNNGQCYVFQKISL